MEDKILPIPNMRKRNYAQAMELILRILKEGKGTSQSKAKQYLEMVQNAAFPNLEAHDRRFHGGKFDEKTMTCKLRENLAKADDPDKMIAEHDKRMTGISNAKASEYLRLMVKKCPNLDPEETLEQIAKIEDKKLQGDAFRWLMKGKVKLPEDFYKVEEARKLADKAKKDPFSYETPQECINELQGAFKRGSESGVKPIDPDTVPELSDKKVLPMGVTTYLVQDDQNGQAAMRKIIDTHWGKDANPWCLLAREEDEDRQDEDAYDRFNDWWYEQSAANKNKYGQTDIFTEENMYDDEMSINAVEDAVMKAQEYYFNHVDQCYEAKSANMRNAWHYWNHYNALPKRVAFKDGKLLTFMATEEDPGGYPRDDYMEYLDANGLTEEDEDYESWFKNHYQKDISEQWWDRNDESHDGIPIGNIPVPNDIYGRWGNAEIINGKLGFRKFEKGSPRDEGYRKWYSDGSIAAFREGDMLAGFNEDGDAYYVQFFKTSNGRAYEECFGRTDLHSDVNGGNQLRLKVQKRRRELAQSDIDAIRRQINAVKK